MTKILRFVGTVALASLGLVVTSGVAYGQFFGSGLPKGCADGQVPGYNIATGKWVCAASQAGIATGSNAALGSLTITPGSDRQALTPRCFAADQTNFNEEWQGATNNFLRGQRCDGSIDAIELATPATNPAAGRWRYYFKTGTGLCWKNSAGVETCAGTGGASYVAGPSGLITIDTTPNPDTIDVTPGTMPTLAGANSLTGRNDFAGPLKIPYAAGAPAATACDEASEYGDIKGRSDGASGQKTYLCTASGWELQGGGGGTTYIRQTLTACANNKAPNYTNAGTVVGAGFNYPASPNAPAPPDSYNGSGPPFSICAIPFPEDGTNDRYVVMVYPLVDWNGSSTADLALNILTNNAGEGTNNSIDTQISTFCISPTFSSVNFPGISWTSQGTLAVSTGTTPSSRYNLFTKTGIDLTGCANNHLLAIKFLVPAGTTTVNPGIVSATLKYQ